MADRVKDIHWFSCEHPKLVRNRYTGELVQVACGKCPACLNKKQLRWSVPLQREATLWKYKFFVTLTYNDTFLPRIDLLNYKPDKNLEEYAVLCKASEDYLRFMGYKLPYCPTKDLQLFNKRLREIVFRETGERASYRYFFSSDYGSTTFRPHWHGLIFTNNDKFAASVETFVHNAWSLFSRTCQRRAFLGNVQVEPAVSGGKYVSTYVLAAADRPRIYEFRDFKPRSFHSSNPPLGSVIKSYETIDEIIDNGLTEVTLFDPVTGGWSKQPLTPQITGRLFPTIPSYSSLNRAERLSVIRTVYESIDLPVDVRRHELYMHLHVDSFWRDYVTRGEVLTHKQIIDKLDRIYYAVSRMVLNCRIYNYSLSDYDFKIESFYVNRYKKSLYKQFEYEDIYLRNGGDINDLLNAIDIALAENERKLDSLPVSEPYQVSPFVYDSSYFSRHRELHNKLIKRKCNNAYLELHPEFKQFHS